MIGNWLKNKTVLGINQRNVDYVLKYNARKRYPLVDNKILSKRLAIVAGIAVPELYHVVETERMLKTLPQYLSEYHDFVIKPAHGAGGDGVLVIKGRHQDKYQKANRRMITYEDIAYHISNILSGVYSLGGHSDQAMIEYCVTSSNLFESITYQGVPDIRILVLSGYPVMAMLRLPTKQSNGRANLHQGAVGVGIDLQSGKTTEGVWCNDHIAVHPDTGASIAGLYIPKWQQCLQLASQCYDLTQLGFLGVDIVLDQKLGPLILEMNARPGLNIQIANDRGLLQRLKVIESQTVQRTVTERVEFSKQYFPESI